ncbi:MAG: FHA domain-containing protein [Ilumatobacter sp.]|nr:FHA domain-containing protein [Ilumatobacter sp.]
MTDQVLDILKLVLLALLYLFFARVLWAVWSEVRAPADSCREFQPAGPSPTPVAPSPTPAAGIVAEGRRNPKPVRGRGERPARLVVIEPKERKGTAFAIDGDVTVGREADNTIVVTDDSYISSHHARVTLADGHAVVDDLSSRNGTFLNGARLTRRHTVRVGDRIQVGYTVLEAQ